MGQSTLQGIHYQLLQAPPFVINFSGDLKYGIALHLCFQDYFHWDLELLMFD